MEDTIAAISTALGVGAISIIRVSGKDAISITSKIFSKDLTKVKSHTINYGKIIADNEIIDEVLVSVMKAPKTFTREDVVEINCHGGISTTNKILEVLLNNGARLAEPGEFTKRAFLNGRIDLTEAEGIMNLIESKSELTRKMSINQLTGKVSSIISELRNELISIISNIEVNIDYPEYEDIEVLTNQKIYPKLITFKNKLQNIITAAEDGKIIKEGIKIGIIGKPNVGKSSLLNALIEEDKAIVTNIEGTTRDIVEGEFLIDGLLCHIIDTAGIRETDNVIEKIGVEKSYSIIESADLVIYMLNNNEELTLFDKQILEKLKSKNHIIVINKIDLDKKIEEIKESHIEISVKENIGIDKIRNRILEIYNIGKIKTADLTYLSNARSISLLKQSLSKIENSIKNINDFPIDMIEVDLRECWQILGEIIGETYTNELIDEIFSRFCLGK